MYSCCVGLVGVEVKRRGVIVSHAFPCHITNVMYTLWLLLFCVGFFSCLPSTDSDQSSVSDREEKKRDKDWKIIIIIIIIVILLFSKQGDVALAYKDLLLLSTLDGKLFAVDKQTGDTLWRLSSSKQNTCTNYN